MKQLLKELHITKLESWMYLTGLLSAITFCVISVIRVGWWNPLESFSLLSEPLIAALFLTVAPLSLVASKMQIRSTIAGLDWREMKGLIVGIIFSMILMTSVVLIWNLNIMILAVFLAYHAIQVVLLYQAITDQMIKNVSTDLNLIKWEKNDLGS